MELPKELLMVIGMCVLGIVCVAVMLGFCELSDTARVWTSTAVAILALTAYFQWHAALIPSARYYAPVEPFAPHNRTRLDVPIRSTSSQDVNFWIRCEWGPNVNEGDRWQCLIEPWSPAE